MSSTLEIIKRQYKSYIDKIKEPSGCCQACLSETLNQGPIVTCSICQSSIHSNHYGHELIGPIKFQGEWKCQRCKFLIQKSFKVQVKCKFCPSLKGIIKKIKLNSNQIWIHPQCSTWCFPIIFQINNNKRIIYSQQYPSTSTSKFWCRIQKQKQSKCQICSISQGYKIKCCFYSCQKFYHATCAKKIGVIRDLESMKFQKSDQYCPPYCQTHLQVKVLDCANRIKLYTENNQNEKVALFTQIHNGYRIQLKNLHMFVKKFKQEEQMRNQLGKQMLVQNCQESSMSLSISNRSLLSDHPSQFYAFLQNKINSEQLQKIIQEKQKQFRKNKIKQIMSYKKDIIRQNNKLKNFPGISSYSNCQESSYGNNQNEEGFQQYKFHQSASSSSQSIIAQERKNTDQINFQNENINEESGDQIEEQRKQVELQEEQQYIQQMQQKQLCYQDQINIYNLQADHPGRNIQNNTSFDCINQANNKQQKEQPNKQAILKMRIPSKQQLKPNQSQQSKQQNIQQQVIYQSESQSEYVKQKNRIKNVVEQPSKNIYQQQDEDPFQQKKQSNSEYSSLYEEKEQQIKSSITKNLKTGQITTLQKSKEQPIQESLQEKYKIQIRQKGQSDIQITSCNKEKNQRVRQKSITQQMNRKQNKKNKKIMKRISLSKLQSSSSPEQQSEDELYELDEEQSED